MVEPQHERNRQPADQNTGQHLPHCCLGDTGATMLYAAAGGLQWPGCWQMSAKGAALAMFQSPSATRTVATVAIMVPVILMIGKRGCGYSLGSSSCSDGCDRR